jgi:hypothetical protein
VELSIIMTDADSGIKPKVAVPAPGGTPALDAANTGAENRVKAAMAARQILAIRFIRGQLGFSQGMG